jgi:hypothetical protein
MSGRVDAHRSSRSDDRARTCERRRELERERFGFGGDRARTDDRDDASTLVERPVGEERCGRYGERGDARGEIDRSRGHTPLIDRPAASLRYFDFE